MARKIRGAAAVSARLTHHALSLYKQPLSAPPAPRCGECGKGGHKTKNCAGGEGKGKPWGLAWDQGASLEQELARNAFATSGAAYPSRQGRETIPREDWKLKLETEAFWATAEEKTGPCPVCKEKHV